MKLKKILFCISLILVSIISFSGCAKVELMRTVDSYSVIMDKLVVTLDKDKLLNNYTTVRAAVVADMVQFRNYVHDWIEGYKDEYPKVYLDMKDGIVCEIPESQNNELSIVITFADISFFAVFYGLATINDVEYVLAVKVYSAPIEPGETSEYALKQIYLSSDADNEVATLFGDTYTVLALSQATQTAGVGSAAEALNKAFGDLETIDENTLIEWFTTAVPNP